MFKEVLVCSMSMILKTTRQTPQGAMPGEWFGRSFGARPSSSASARWETHGALEICMGIDWEWGNLCDLGCVFWDFWEL